MVEKQGNYLEFISNEDLYECIGTLYEEYRKALQEKGIREFFKNRVDPLRLKMDSLIMGISFESILESEVLRQTEKTISNAIGTFQEKLIGKIQGYEHVSVGGRIDIKSEDNKIIAEIKNKHNTLKGENNKDLFNKLERELEYTYKGYTAYYVRIIDTKSRDEEWKFTSKAENDKEKKKIYHNENIKRISGDKFYQLITGDKHAFKKLITVLPKAVEDYISKLPDEDVIKHEDATAVSEIKKLATINKRSLFDQVVASNFYNYDSFKEK